MLIICLVRLSGDFSGWSTSTERLPEDTSGIPPGVVVCFMPVYRWVEFLDQEAVTDHKSLYCGHGSLMCFKESILTD